MGHPNSKYRRPPAPPPPPQCRRDGSPMVGVTDPHLNIVPASTANKDEGKSEMSGGRLNTLSSRPDYFRRCKKHKRLIETNIECLPDDLVVKILVNLPAQDIYNAAMLVHRKWYRMVHSRAFVYAHLHHSPHGLLLETIRGICTSVTIRQGRIEIYKFPQIFLSPVSASCNGLILQENGYNKHLYITGQEFGIPRHPQGRSGTVFHASLGYSPSAMEYKVVVWHEYDEKPINCRIFTVGVDKSWRDVCTQYISKSFFILPAKLTQGFMHWYSDTHIWTLNLETEIMTQTPVPRHVNNRHYLFDVQYIAPTSVESKYYLSTPGKSLSVLVWLSQLCWDIWDVRSETGEWTKTGHIDLKAERRRLYQLRGRDNAKVQDPMVLIPAGWLEYRAVLVLFFASPKNSGLHRLQCWYTKNRLIRVGL